MLRFQNDSSTPTTKLLLGPLSFARGQKISLFLQKCDEILYAKGLEIFMLKSLSDMFATFLKLLETFPSSILPQKFKKKPKNALKNKPSMHSVEEIGFLDKSSGKERSKSF